MSRAQTHLYVAYVITWVIHIAYLIMLTRKAARLRKDAEELSRHP
jgi:hypothetical protein